MISTAVFAAPLVESQSEIADADLLDLLETVNQVESVSEAEITEGVSTGEVSVITETVAALVETEPVAVADDPLVRVLESVQEAEQLVSENEAVGDAFPGDDSEPVEEGAVDDLGMELYDEDAASTSGNLISVRLNKVGLEEAINLFAQLSGANIIVPELTEAAQISVNLKDVEWRPALQSILDSYNYELYQRVSGSNVYSVRRRPAGAPEPQVVETFKLNYATVPNAAILIRQLLPPDAKVSEFASRNMIVVKSTESSLSEVRAVLSSIDTVRQQVYIESKFMELSDGVQKDIGIDWRQLGLDEQGNGGLNASIGDSQQTYTDGRLYNGSTAVDFSEHVFTSVLDVEKFNLVLNALQADKGVNVVSNPKIIVANEEKANISIVRKEPNLKQERQQTGGAGDAPIDNITFELDPQQPFFEYGIKLDVTPSINTSSNISVSIKPSLTRKFADKPAGENTYPIIDEKTVETIFSLTSGQTAAIGGLTEVSDSEIERKVPLLGSMPLLGRLFSWQQTVSDQTETIIFVTVGLANTGDVNVSRGLPEDSELARRRVIIERNQRVLREQGRTYFETQDGEKLDDTLKSMQQKEESRVDRRNRALKKEAEKAAKKAAKVAVSEGEVASIN
jgi:type II secretory pathway component GspD/PulD (secretin)